MYVQQNDVAGFSETLAKVRKKIHKIFPRELSPTRMGEKYGADAKKKGAKRLSSVGAESAAKNAIADALLGTQLTKIKQSLPDEIAPDFQTRPTTAIKPTLAKYAKPLMWLGVAAALALLYGARRK